MSWLWSGGLFLVLAATVGFVFWTLYAGLDVGGSNPHLLSLAVAGFLVCVFFVGVGLSGRTRNPY